MLSLSEQLHEAFAAERARIKASPTPWMLEGLDTPATRLAIPENMRKSTQASRKLDVYGPNAVLLERRSWNDTKRVDGFIVPGTNGIFAAYECTGTPGRWISLHIPTGLAIRQTHPNRDEAEEICCWIYCNTADKESLCNTNSAVVVEAMGARVRSRFTHGRPFLKKDIRTQKIGKHETVQTVAEQSWVHRIREIEGYRRQWRADHDAAMRSLETGARTLEGREKNIEKRETALQERWNAVNAQAEVQERHRLDQDARRALQLSDERQLNYLRDRMINALASLDDEDILEERPVMRNLRKVNIREATPDQSAPDGSS